MNDARGRALDGPPTDRMAHREAAVRVCERCGALLVDNAAIARHAAATGHHNARLFSAPAPAVRRG
jgi:hypothetical protein